MFIHTRHLLVAILLALLALPAAAHDHPAPGAGSETHGGEFTDAHSWSKSCPAAPGQLCCCGGLFAALGSGKPAPVNAPALARALARAAGAAKFSDSSVPYRALDASHQARPRAPPLSS